MPKAFLSHSSAQKKIVEKIATDLKSFAIIDSKSFEEGQENLEEIIKNIDKSDLFVLFISEEALKSRWVTDELNYAKNQLDKNRLSRIYPLLIDPRIQYNDERIPEWLRLNYNLKHVLRIGKATRLIKRRLQEISWNFHPNLKERDTIFVGRNEQIKKTEERLDDINKNSPIVFVASGLPKIGRRTFIKNALIKTSTIKDSYDFPAITLTSRESIEDFIVKIYDLGFSEEIDFPDFLEISLDKKIELLVKMIGDYQALNEIILVEDAGGIFLYDRSMAPWFAKLLDTWSNYQLKDQITICIASQYKPRATSTVGYDDIFNIELPELSKIETGGLLKRLAALNEISISPDHLKEITDGLDGFPEQVRYCIELLTTIGIRNLLKEFNLVRDYQKSIFNSVVSEIESDPNYKALLSVLVEFDFISFELLNEILSDLGQSLLEKMMDNLIGRSILETIGTNKEYFRLNQGIKVFLQRAGYLIDLKYKEKLKRHIENYLKSTSFLGSDLSDFFYSLKGALLNNFSIKNKLVLPSHYLKTMITLYEQDRNYSDVVVLADRVLERESKFDLAITYEIRYWLCLALARLKNERLKNEVRYFAGSDHDFLLGFYYRLNGQAEYALERFEAALRERPRFSRAQSELVRILTYLELYEEALHHARLNYENESNNPYHIQAYFDCLIRRKNNSNNIDIIKQLLEELKELNIRKAKEMAAVAVADYELFINHDIETALKLVDKALDEFNQSPYLLYKKFNIAEKGGHLFEMANTILKYEKISRKDNSNEQNTLNVMRAKLEAQKGNRPGAIDYINKLKGIPTRAKTKLLESVGIV